MKPKLIESKLLKYYNNKYKFQPVVDVQPVEIPIPFYQKILDYIWIFIKNNYGFFILFILIITLLYIRYIEVNKRKEKLKELLDD